MVQQLYKQTQIGFVTLKKKFFLLFYFERARQSAGNQPSFATCLQALEAAILNRENIIRKGAKNNYFLMTGPLRGGKGPSSARGRGEVRR